MVLIIGGMSQGKLDFARRQLGVSSWSEGRLGPEDCVYGFQEVVRHTPEAREAADAWCTAHPGGVIICDEVGCGVTPMDRADRVWREQVGRICCHLAEEAEAVYRGPCGLGTRLK